MKVMLASVALTAMVLASAAWAVSDVARGEGTAQDTVSIGVDTDPTGNTATSLGPIESCKSLSSGETLEVDVFVADVTDLLAWETYFAYDISIINIVSRDVMMFQAANEGSQVFDVSEGLPDIDGRYGIAAVDLADPPALDSGSGVLARLTVKAMEAGVSPISLSPIDVNGDGTMDLGPTLKGFRGESISDADGDGFFDGPIHNGQIAVDAACPSGTPAPPPTVPGESPSPVVPASPVAETPSISPTAETPAAGTPTETATPPPATPTVSGPDSTQDEGSAWTGGPAIIGYILGSLAAVLLGGAALLAIRRRRAR